MSGVKILLFFFLLIVSISIHAKEIIHNDSVQYNNSVYLELGGNGLVYSLNYDHRIPLNPEVALALRLGFQKINNFNKNGMKTTTFPLELTGLINVGEKRNFFEFGPGISFMHNVEDTPENTENIRYFTFRIGYRYQKPKGGFLFRGGLVFLNDVYTSNPQKNTTYHTWHVIPGISLGISF